MFRASLDGYCEGCFVSIIFLNYLYVSAQVALAAHADSGGSVQAIAESLLAHAQKQRSKDDISVIAITLAAD